MGSRKRGPVKNKGGNGKSKRILARMAPKTASGRTWKVVRKEQAERSV